MIAAMAAGLLTLAVSCTGQRGEESAVTRVRLFAATGGGTSTLREFPGRVMAAEEVNMAFKVGGTLKGLPVEEGDRVRKGELVAEIDPRDYQVQYDAAEAEYMKVKADAERVMALYADSVGTAGAYDNARYGLRQIAAKYENARNQLADTKIYAPFDGYVQKRLYDPPTVVAAGMPVVTLVSGARPEVEINIPASTYLRRQEMVAFQATFDFLPEGVPLRLVSIAPKANANQLYCMRLSLPDDVRPLPTPGMNTMVGITVRDEGVEKTEVPSSALFKKGGESCVWVYDKTAGAVRARAVTVERLLTDGMAVIARGLAPGEAVVTAGVRKLTDGQKVEPMAEESETNVGGLL